MWHSRIKTLIILIQTFELFAQNLRELKEEPIRIPHLETTSHPKENLVIVLVNKCCGINEVLNSSGCIPSDIPFDPNVAVYAHNETDIEDEPIPAQNIVFRPVVRHIVCSSKKYPLIQNQDQYVLLQNGTLLVLSVEKILPPENYCFETINFANQTNSDWLTTPIICIEDEVSKSSTIIYISYGIGILVSALLLIVTAVIFSSIEEIRDARGKCVVGYSITMAVVFILLANAQFSGIGNTTCTVFGFIIQFFLVQSFAWLTMLGWETFYKIKNYDNDRFEKDGARFKIYAFIGIVVPILLTSLISYKGDRVPGIPNTFLKPKFGRSECSFDQSAKSLLCFNFPIAVADLFNIILWILMKSYLIRYEKNGVKDVIWRIIKFDLVSMYRSYVFVLIISNICWLMKAIPFFIKDLGNFGITMDIIDSLQGAFIFAIFVLHRPVQQLVKLRLVKNQNTEASYENNALGFHRLVRNELDEQKGKKFYPLLEQMENPVTDTFCKSHAIYCAGHSAISIKIQFNHSVE